MKDLAFKGCFGGDSKRVLYRQEQPKHAGSHEGWYLCMYLKYSNQRGLEIQVTSCHYRLNRPNNIRTHGTVKFFVILNRFMKGKI